MTADETARALVAHPRWPSPWPAGLRVVNADGDPGRITDEAEAVVWWEHGGWWSSAAKAGPFDDLAPAVLDLADPATAGVVLELVASEVEGQDLTITYAAPMRAPDERAWTLALSDTIGAGDTLGHAAALALLHIWTETP